MNVGIIIRDGRPVILGPAELAAVDRFVVDSIAAGVPLSRHAERVFDAMITRDDLSTHNLDSTGRGRHSGMGKDSLSRAAAADLAGRSVPTIDRWRRAGLPWHTDEDGRIRIDRSDLEEWRGT